MLSQIFDVTEIFNANNQATLDLGLFNQCTIQVTGSISGTIDIKGSNDGGAVQGSTDGNPTSATNFSTIQATKLSDGSAVTVIAAAGLYSLTVKTKYLRIGGANAATTGKVLIFANTVV